VYAKFFVKRYREIIEPKLEDTRCGFLPSRSTTDQIFTSQQMIEKSWKYGKDFYTCFVDHEKAQDWVPREKPWETFREYGVDFGLLLTVKSLHSCSEACVRFSGVRSQALTLGVGLPQGCVLSPLFFSLHLIG